MVAKMATKNLNLMYLSSASDTKNTKKNEVTIHMK